MQTWNRGRGGAASLGELSCSLNVCSLLRERGMRGLLYALSLPASSFILDLEESSSDLQADLPGSSADLFPIFRNQEGR